jgi:ABC-2 type transport system permease protein
MTSITFLADDTLTAPSIELPAAPSTSIGLGRASVTVAGRTVRQFFRTPQLIVVGALTGAMFLLIFRYVFGGAIGTGSVSYADFLIPALAATSGLFSGGAVGVATDIEGGLFDRLKSLPIPRSSVLIGRSIADTGLILWAAFVSVVIGYATGFRFHGNLGEALAAIALVALFAFVCSWPMIFIGLAAGNSQAAQGMSFMTFPFVFVSSTYVPVDSMPGWMQPIAREQPVTAMVGAIRSLSVGSDADAVLGHSTSWFVVRALLWSVVIVALFGTLATRKFAKS